MDMAMRIAHRAGREFHFYRHRLRRFGENPPADTLSGSDPWKSFCFSHLPHGAIALPTQYRRSQELLSTGVQCILAPAIAGVNITIYDNLLLRMKKQAIRTQS